MTKTGFNHNLYGAAASSTLTLVKQSAPLSPLNHRFHFHPPQPSAAPLSIRSAALHFIPDLLWHSPPLQPRQNPPLHPCPSMAQPSTPSICGTTLRTTISSTPVYPWRSPPPHPCPSTVKPPDLPLALQCEAIGNMSQPSALPSSLHNAAIRSILHPSKV